MTGLIVDGDSRSWLSDGYAIGLIAARLDRALADAGSGAKSVEHAWYGPAATGFSACWAGQYARCEDLLVLVVRAARAITAYGQALENSQARARALEYTWCAAGLTIASDGYLALPFGAAALSPEARLPLERVLTDANRDIEHLGYATAEAVVSLVTALNPVVVLLEEFGLPAFGAAFVERFGREVGHDAVAALKDVGGDAIAIFGMAADATQKLGPTKDWQNVGAWTSRVTEVSGVALAPAEVLLEARHQGYLESIEDHAGALVSSFPAVSELGAEGGDLALDALAGGAALAGAPEIAATIGVAVLGAVVAVGVGAVVQAVVDHNRTRINDLVHDIGSIF